MKSLMPFWILNVTRFLFGSLWDLLFIFKITCLGWLFSFLPTSFLPHSLSPFIPCFLFGLFLELAIHWEFSIWRCLSLTLECVHVPNDSFDRFPVPSFRNSLIVNEGQPTLISKPFTFSPYSLSFYESVLPSGLFPWLYSPVSFTEFFISVDIFLISRSSSYSDSFFRAPLFPGCNVLYHWWY